MQQPTIKRISVQNMQSQKGNDIPNQFEIFTPEGKYFQSYNTIIAFKPTGAKGGITKTGVRIPELYLDKEKWNYSVTTGKYRNIFLGESKKETEAKIKSGVYKLTELN